MRPPASEDGAPGLAGLFDAAGPVRIMGILNVTPDSFSDGGAHASPGAALDRARAMIAEGADLIDVGGESTRPGSLPVPPEEQLRRILPVVKALGAESDVPVSIDTTWAAVARPCLEAGAAVVNDISAGREDPALLPLVAETGAGVVLMHMQGTPRNMQESPRYGDVVAEVRRFLADRRAAALEAGVAPGRMALDPGFGFGKTVTHNLLLLRHLPRLADLGAPLLAGLSRKSTVGAVLDLPVGERLEGSLAAAVLAVAGGARLLRVHDVRATRRAVRFAEAVLAAGEASAEDG
jgi:dihydropteroate synthase